MHFSSPYGPLERWLESNRSKFLIALAVLAIVIRVVYLSQLWSSPCIDQQRWHQTDMAYFDSWARSITNGDWLSANIRPPIHRWHEAMAAEFLNQHPEATSHVFAEAAKKGLTPVQVIWERWLGPGRFYQDPLYSYLIALTYYLFGPDHRVVLGWQLALGVLNVLLVATLARRIFGEVAGACAGIMMLANPISLFYELLLLRETLLLTLTLLALLLFDRLRERPRASTAFSLALTIVAAFLVKSVFVLLGAGLVVATLVRGLHRGSKRTWLWAFLAGIALALLPLALRNVSMGLPPLAINSGGPITFINSNAPDAIISAGGEYLGFPSSVRLIEASHGSFFTAIAMTLAEHGSAFSVARQLCAKFVLIWHWYEIPSNANFYYYRLHASVLRFLPFTFGLVGPLGALGMLLSLRMIKRTWPLHLAVVAQLATMVAFMVLSRQRLPMMVCMVPFAAFALLQLATWVRDRRLAVLIVTAIPFIALVVWVQRPLPDGIPLIRPADYAVGFDLSQPEIRRMAELGLVGEVRVKCDKMLRLFPLELRLAVERGSALRSQADVALGDIFTYQRRFCAEKIDEAFLRSGGLRRGPGERSITPPNQPGTVNKQFDHFR
jgi:4-amino-4-deoxy-L-arabinose transferase-like glycosyltransferase